MATTNVFKIYEVNRDVLAFLTRNEVEKSQLINKSINYMVLTGNNFPHCWFLFLFFAENNSSNRKLSLRKIPIAAIMVIPPIGHMLIFNSVHFPRRNVLPKVSNINERWIHWLSVLDVNKPLDFSDNIEFCFAFPISADNSLTKYLKHLYIEKLYFDKRYNPKDVVHVMEILTEKVGNKIPVGMVNRLGEIDNYKASLPYITEV